MGRSATFAVVMVSLMSVMYVWYGPSLSPAQEGPVGRVELTSGKKKQTADVSPASSELSASGTPTADSTTASNPSAAESPSTTSRSSASTTTTASDGSGTGVTAASSAVSTLYSNASGSLIVTVNGTHRHVAKVEPDSGLLAFPSSIKTVHIEVGTNDVPEFGPIIVGQPDTVLVAFEPQPPVFRDMLKKFPVKDRLIALPAAVTPTQSFVSMNVAEHKGCSSLLSMNQKLERFAGRQKGKAIKKSMAIQLRTMEYCAKKAEKIQVPSFPLRDLLSRIPPTVNIGVVGTDAQGYDLHVVSTIGIRQARRIPILIVECQDITPGDTLMLVEGAPNCNEVRRCIEHHFPHRLSFCWDNAPRAREMNCIYVNREDFKNEPARLIPPPQLKIVSVNRTLYYKPREDFECPAFAP